MNRIVRSSAEALAQLEQLVRFGWLEAKGKGEKRQYRLAGLAREALGEGASRPIRASVEELEQREALILDHVRAHGQITRSEVASLCRVSSDQARHLLRRLVQQQQLVARGKGRGTYYELPPE
ncbi:MAG: DNA glycosylase AlkZ-like family protein [Anaerolineae bacterium]